MPLCCSCNEYLPPDLCIDVDGGLAKKCVYCVRGVSEVTLEDGSLMSKQFAIYDYKEFVKSIVSSQEYKNIVVEAEVRKYVKN